MARELRRLAAIVAADVVGYSRLMGRDESGTLAVLKALRREVIDPCIVSYGGRIVKTTGDGLLLEFSSVVNAVRFTVEVQSAIVSRNAGIPDDRRIAFRVGINLGDVIVDDDDIFGDGVNIAVRLQELAAPGGVCISSRVHDDVRDRLDAVFEDGGSQTLKNITRSIQIWRWSPGAAATQQGPKTPTAPEKVGRPRLSIVVLPFANISGDPDQEYFADGVTESLTTDLSRMAGMLVIGRNTAFTFKGKCFDSKDLGRELGVRYLLEGSVQRGPDRIRVNAQLINAETGNHLWAERFDKPLADLLDMQDEIVARLASQLGTQLISAEARRAEGAPNPDSLDLYFQGMACVAKGTTPEYLAQASGYFDRALTLDPGNIQALVRKAYVDTQKAALHAIDDRAKHLAAAEVALTKALALAPEDASAHLYLGYGLIMTNRANQGIAECERALSLDQNLAFAHALVGLAKLYVGCGDETEAHVQEALRLSPRDTFAYIWMFTAGAAKLYLGNNEEAVIRLRRSIEINRNLPNAHFLLGAALAHLDRLDEAQSAVQVGLSLFPSFTVRRYQTDAASDNSNFLVQRERVVEGLRKAGTPEA